jgi:hypothetical protein
MILFTRAIIGLWRIAPEGASKQRLEIGMLGSVAALGLWAVLIGVGFAEASVADSVAAATAAGAAEAAGRATIIATALHAAYFGIYQITSYVAFIMLIPIGGGLAISGIVRREFGWLVMLIGVAMVIVTSVMPIKTADGITAFGIIAVVFGVVFLAMGLQIVRQDME